MAAVTEVKAPLPESGLILADQVREAVGTRRVWLSSPVAANLLAALLLVAAMYDQMPSTVLYGWLGVQVCFQLLRALSARWYWRRPPDSAAAVRGWARYLSAMAVVSGVIWGSAGVLFYSEHSTVHQALLAILLCGLAAGSIPANAMLRIGLLGSASAILGLFIARLIWAGGESHWLMVAMLTVYLLFVLNWGRGLNRVLIESLRQRHENEELIEQLRQQTDCALQAQRAAESASVAKSKFLAAASHDLRQPMHAMTLLSGALLEEERPDELKALTRHIVRSVEALEMLFNALLDISKLDAGITHPNNKDLVLENLFERLRSDFTQMAANKYLRFHMRPTPAVVRADAQLLEQILRNLLSNAVRYTETGGILVGCRKRGERWCIDIVDTGIGIPADEQDKVFDEFYQIGNRGRDRNQGLGLGLAIVRRLVRLMGLAIELRSRPGHGTAFSLFLPMGTGEVEPEPAPAPVLVDLFDMRRVLIVDDEADVRLALALLLVGWGCDVLDAESYEQVVAEMEQGEWRPELAIVDLRLGGEETGIDLLHWLREHVGADLLGIIVTGDIASERLQEVKTSGYTLLHKPVAPAKLRALMQHLIGQRGLAPAAAVNPGRDAP